MYINDLELLWEDQACSSALYALQNGVVIGIAASIAVNGGGTWRVYNPLNQPIQALASRGPVLAVAGSREQAKTRVEKDIVDASAA